MIVLILHILTCSLASHIIMLESYGSLVRSDTIWSPSTGTVIVHTYTALPDVPIHSLLGYYWVNLCDNKVFFYNHLLFTGVVAAGS